MIVNKIAITDDQIRAGEAAMTGTFTAADINEALIRAGVTADNYTSYRAADRLIQKARKAGQISLSGRNWRRTDAS